MQPAMNAGQQTPSPSGLTRVGKSAASPDNQSTDPLSLRERAGVRVKCLNIHQPPVGTSLVAALPTPVSSLWERAGVRVKCLNIHQPPVGTSLVAALPTPVSPQGEGRGEGETPTPVSSF